MTALIAATLILTATALAKGPSLALRTSNTIVATWKCSDQLGQPRQRAASPWKPGSDGYRRHVLNIWRNRLNDCRRELHRIAAINRNLYRIAVCETGGKPGQNGLPDWNHRARSEHPGLYYEGSLGFLQTTWDSYKPAGYPDGAHQATPAQQYVVARRLIARFGNYGSWPACSERLGLR